ALLGNQAGQFLCVKTADCLPILLVDERNHAVAAVNAGWRGTLLQIASKAVQEMEEQFGTLPTDLHAALGPAIGQCCFEVGPEVAVQFGAAPVRTKLNLVTMNQEQLVRTGVPASRIYFAELCTRCRAGEFHSYRKDRDQSGRMRS